MRNEAGQRLIEFCQENALVIANTLFQQHKRRFYTWTSPDGQHRNQIDYILCSQRWRSYVQSAKTRPGVDCGSDHELLIAKFRFLMLGTIKTLEVSNILKVAQMVKNLRAVQETWVGKIPWRRDWQPIPVFLLGESHGQKGMMGPSPWCPEQLGTTEWMFQFS